MRIHRIFGIHLASDFSFKSHLQAGEPPVDLVFTCKPDAPGGLAAPAADESCSGRTSESEGAGYVDHLETLDVVRFPDLADFYVSEDRIECHALHPSVEDFVEIQLLGSTLSYWLERGGIPTLHGSAVEIDQRAIGFLSSHSGGKTGLAAALMSRGHRLLTDDVLPIEQADGVLLGRPGYPQMRMWPDEAAHFVAGWEDLETVHPGYSKRRIPVSASRFCDVPRPLGCLYLPRRRPPEEMGPEVKITPLGPRDAVIELVRHSFLPYVVETVGWQSRRLDFFARLAGQIPVRRLVYPSGYEHLPTACDELLKDLETI